MFHVNVSTLLWICIWTAVDLLNHFTCNTKSVSKYWTSWIFKWRTWDDWNVKYLRSSWICCSSDQSKLYPIVPKVLKEFPKWIGNAKILVSNPWTNGVHWYFKSCVHSMKSIVQKARAEFACTNHKYGNLSRSWCSAETHSDICFYSREIGCRLTGCSLFP